MNNKYIELLKNIEWLDPFREDDGSINTTKVRYLEYTDVNALILAVIKQNKLVVEALIEMGADVNAITKIPLPSRENSALCIAAEKGLVDIIELLIAKGVDLDAVVQDNTALCIAISYALTSNKSIFVDIIDLLLANGADVNQATKRWGTPLCIAADHIKKQILETLINKNADVEKSNELGEAPLYLIVQSKGTRPTLRKERIEIINLLLQCGADVNKATKSGNTPLHAAIKNGDIETVKLLVSKGADVNKANKKGNAALYVASHLENDEIVDFLLKNGSDIDEADTESFASFYIAIKNDDIQEVENLLKKGLDPNKKYKHSYELSRKHNPLHLAIEHGRKSIVELLIKYGADVNGVLDYATPIHAAIVSGHKDILEILVKNGANLKKIPKYYGEPPLTIAKRIGRLDIVEFLIQHGCKH